MTIVLAMVIDHCPCCGEPTHASESNDHGVCVTCLNDEATARDAHEEAEVAREDSLMSEDERLGWSIPSYCGGGR